MIEWKYTEKYNEVSKAQGREGYNRLNIYRKFCEPSICPLDINTIYSKLGQINDLDIDDVMNVFFYEPFYQLLREQLIAHEIEKNNKDIDKVTLLHICSKNNYAFHHNITSPKLKNMFPRKTVIEIWKYLVRPKDRFKSTSPEELFQKYPQDKFPELENWVKYISSRYRLKNDIL